MRQGVLLAIGLIMLEVTNVLDKSKCPVCKNKLEAKPAICPSVKYYYSADLDMIDTFDSIPFTKYKQFAVPVRIFLAVVIVMQFFGFYDFLSEFLYFVVVFSILYLINIAFEKSKMSTVNIVERKYPQCELPMDIKVIKYEKCKIQIDVCE